MLTGDALGATAPDACFLHCLPVRRNVEVHDSVLDGAASRVVANAGNRFHVQRVLLDMLLNPGS
jgi:N-acetylornithine carbamoyltransferase